MCIQIYLLKWILSPTVDAACTNLIKPVCPEVGPLEILGVVGFRMCQACSNPVHYLLPSIFFLSTRSDLFMFRALSSPEIIVFLNLLKFFVLLVKLLK